MNIRFGEFTDKALEREFRLAVMTREVRQLRIGLLTLMLFRLFPIAFDFYTLPLAQVTNLLLPLRMSMLALSVAILLLPADPRFYTVRHAGIMVLLTGLFAVNAVGPFWFGEAPSPLGISFPVAIIVIMNYVLLPTRWSWMVAWGVVASLLHLLVLLPITGPTPTQTKMVLAMLFVVNAAGAFISAQLASLSRRDYLHLRQLQQANRELRERETVIAEQRDRLSEKVVALEEVRQRLIDTQDDLVRAEKMAALGGMVAGVAHELNTPIGIALTAITHIEDGVADLNQAVADGKLTRTRLAEYQTMLQESAQLVHVNIARAAELVQSFKRVSVDQASEERRPFLLRHYIEEVLSSLGPRLRREPHRISVDCPADLDMDSYPGALFQVLTNLVMNAVIHAFDPGKVGTITITGRALPEDRVELVFQDNGRGVHPDHLSRLFEPFFTTNRSRGGSGLGLHIVFNLVTQTLKGSIAVNSADGEGTCFILTLPRHLPAAEVSLVELLPD
ncbi:hypothetical protein CHU95_09370 [Niveispirillum lacus]|uniref:histidine kinase n=1 Tax=Niveispirillum lacus TaxID=1981099 RepID=A0A255Z1I4_9PROT|nr:ATP-binding protein [Niveispirillum lacus]OYQ34794.1 hypothetical protein CHU95_09370 [Niveispirillum lacus]